MGQLLDSRGEACSWSVSPFLLLDFILSPFQVFHVFTTRLFLLDRLRLQSGQGLALLSSGLAPGQMTGRH